MWPALTVRVQTTRCVLAVQSARSLSACRPPRSSTASPWTCPWPGQLSWQHSSSIAQPPPSLQRLQRTSCAQARSSMPSWRFGTSPFVTTLPAPSSLVCAQSVVLVHPVDLAAPRGARWDAELPTISFVRFWCSLGSPHEMLTRRCGDSTLRTDLTTSFAVAIEACPAAATMDQGSRLSTKVWTSLLEDARLLRRPLPGPSVRHQSPHTRPTANACSGRMNERSNQWLWRTLCAPATFDWHDGR